MVRTRIIYLPLGKLNGHSVVDESTNTTHFSMREYKRPNFCGVKKPAGTYRLSDAVG